MNVSICKNCFGCGVCAAACPKQCISIELNKSGFYEPIVDINTCINCGICLKVCSFKNDFEIESMPISCYESWSKDHKVRHNTSSGGIGFELARMFLNKGFQIIAARYNANKEIVEHYIATDGDSLTQSMGSKYIQSYTLNALKALDLKRKTFISGTPCQIASIRRWIRLKNVEENFVLMDFFCHGVPSALAWKNYLAIYREITGKLIHVSWRDKDTNWQDSWAMKLSGEKGNIHIRRSEGDLFYSFFLGGWCMNPACRKDCKFKYNKSSADIRIGDLWGSKYEKDKEGVSACVAFTDKGEKIVQSLESCTKIPSTFDIVAQGQMKKNAKGAWLSPFVMNKLQHNRFLSKKEWNIYFRMEFYLHVPYLVFTKIRNLLKI